jgi:hypothetical protein
VDTAWVGCHDRRHPKWWYPSPRAPRPRRRAVSRRTASAFREVGVTLVSLVAPVAGRALPQQTQAVAFNFSRPGIRATLLRPPPHPHQ